MTASNEGLLVRVRQRLPVPLNAQFECRTGEQLALVGPSGSGKTSLLRCIAGLQRPDSGEVSCNGMIWFASDRHIHRAPQRRRVGLVFQKYALFPHLSAIDNVASALRHLPASARKAQAATLLESVNLGGLEAHKPRALSGGQQQRVALARALARDPAVLLLDEPFSAVDQVTRRKLQRELAQLRRRVNLPIVLVTHDLQEARMLADRMCLLHHGIALQTGSPDEVLSRPISALAARLVDIPNIYVGTVISHDASAEVIHIRWLDYQL